MTKKIIWSISGSDCSGGAGIAADIKTGHVLGVEVCSLITANTVQNAQQLFSVNPCCTAILQQQVQALLTDKQPDVIKIGLVANNEQLIWLIACLIKLKRLNPQLKVVFDPVGQASVGGKLSTVNLLDLKPLLPLIDILTPNLYEAQKIANMTTCDSQTLAAAIAKRGVKSVIIKGGHDGTSAKNTCTDSCYENLNESTETKQKTACYIVSSPRIPSNFSHGGGCSFASAISAFIAQGYLLRDAFTLSKAFINQGLLTQLSTDYYGAFEQTTKPTQPQYFPQISSQLALNYQHLPAFATLALSGKKLGLYPVVNSLEWLKRLLPLKLNIIQLRIKEMPPKQLEQTIKSAIALARHYQTRLFINDHWQLAIKHRAYGVHIGQEDLQQADLNEIQQAGLRLGISTHGCYEFLLAQQFKPSYLAIGAIFATKTKDMTGQIQGIANLQHILNLAHNIPVVAIGGINLLNAKHVWKTGVDSIAVVTAITETNRREAESPEQAVAHFKALTEG